MERYKSLAVLRAEKAAKDAPQTIDDNFDRYSYLKRLKNDPVAVKKELYLKIQRVALAHRVIIADADLAKTFDLFYPNGLPQIEPKDAEISTRMPLLAAIEEPATPSPVSYGANLKNNPQFASFLDQRGVDWTAIDARTKEKMWSQFKIDVATPMDDRTEFLRQMSAKYEGDLAQMNAVEKLNLAHLSDTIPHSSGYVAPGGTPSDSIPTKLIEDDSHEGVA